VSVSTSVRQQGELNEQYYTMQTSNYTNTEAKGMEPNVVQPVIISKVRIELVDGLLENYDQMRRCFCVGFHHTLEAHCRYMKPNKATEAGSN